MRRLLGGAFAIIGMLAVTAAASGEEIKRPDSFGMVLGWPTELNGRYPVGTPPGDGWNYVSGDGKVFTSPCIGKLRSPQCVVDTIIACTLWSDPDAGWPYESGSEEIWGHPVCKALINDPFQPGAGIRTFHTPSLEPQNWMHYYKLDFRVVDHDMLQTEGGPQSLVDPIDCKICEGDVAVVPIHVICSPDPGLAGYDRGKLVNSTLNYPPNSPFTYCVDETSDLQALFVRQHPTLEEWFAAWVFNPGQMGSSARPWPLIEDWIRDFHQQSLPGSCPPGLFALTEDCPDGAHGTR